MKNIIPFGNRRTLPGITTPPSPRVKALDEMRSLFERKPATAAAPAQESPAAAPPPATLPPLTIISRGLKALNKLAGFIGQPQRRTVEIALRGEEGQWFMEKMEELAERVSTMPATHENQDGTAHLHYFMAGYDFYMTEKDIGTEDDAPEEFQSQTYGWARFSHMPDCAEYGYVSLPEILASGAELDFHFAPTPIAECIARFETHPSDPSDLSDSSDTTRPEPPPEIQTPPTPPVNIDRIKEKLAKLLRLGEDTAASEGEIQNALNLATQMMAKHQLTREDIDTSAADPTARVAMGRHFAFCKGANLSTWESQLTHFVKEFIGSVSCYCAGKMPVRKNGISAEFFGDGQPRMAQAVCFYGSDDDARCAVDLFEELRDAIATMAITRWGGWARGDGFAYAFGFSQGLRDAHKTAKANLMNQDEQTHGLILKSDSTALAIVNKAQEWLATEHGIRLQSRSSSRRITLRGNAGTALREGRRDGSNYQVTRPGRNKRIG